MKYIAIIFSIYFIWSAVLPCHDSDDMLASVTYKTIQKSHSANNDKGQETCPPFCTCSCCSTARHLTTNITIEIFTEKIQSLYPDYGIPAIQEQPINIWQPPQIS